MLSLSGYTGNYTENNWLISFVKKCGTTSAYSSGSNTVKGSIYTLSGSLAVGSLDVYGQITYSKVQVGLKYVVLQIVGGRLVRRLYSFAESLVS